MHLGFALLTLFPGRVGGSEANVRGLLGEFADGNGPEGVTVLANRHVMASYGDYRRGPVDLHEVRSYRPGDRDSTRALAMVAAAIAPGRAARDVPADLDLLHLPVTVPIPKTGHPRVVTVYDLQHHELPSGFPRAERLLRRWSYDGAARKATLVVTTSEHSRGRLVELVGVPRDRIEVVYMGIDHARFKPAGEDDERVLEGLDLPERFVVYPANLWPHKNHARLLTALGGTDSDELALVLTGQTYGRERALYEQAERAGVRDRVRHLGFVPAAAVPALYRRARGMVFPSLYEGFGSPPLEAMACGCPVAAAGSGSLGEICGDAALRLDPEDPGSIAAAVERLDHDEALRDRLRQAGLQRAAAFTWGHAAERHLELYRRALELDPPRGAT